MDEMHFYYDGKFWDFTIDFRKWTLGIEWSKSMGWFEFNVGCFSLTLYKKTDVL